jgi:hypothetical protein
VSAAKPRSGTRPHPTYLRTPTDDRPHANSKAVDLLTGRGWPACRAIARGAFGRHTPLYFLLKVNDLIAPEPEEASVLELPRSLIRKLCRVFKRLAPHRGSCAALVAFEGGASGLDVRLYRTSIAAAYHAAGALLDGTVIVPLAALADCEGRRSALVSLEKGSASKTRLYWQDASVPQVREYEVESTERSHRFPSHPPS